MTADRLMRLIFKAVTYHVVGSDEVNWLLMLGSKLH